MTEKEHDAHRMYQAGEHMCFNCGAVQNFTVRVPSHERNTWILDGKPTPECPEVEKGRTSGSLSKDS